MCTPGIEADASVQTDGVFGDAAERVCLRHEVAPREGIEGPHEGGRRCIAAMSAERLVELQDPEDGYCPAI